MNHQEGSCILAAARAGRWLQSRGEDEYVDVDIFFVRLQKTALPKLRMPVVRPKLSMMAMGPRRHCLPRRSGLDCQCDL